MKKKLILLVCSGLLISACLPAFLQPDISTASPAPISNAGLEATAAVISRLTLQALPTPTVAPSETPVITTVTFTSTSTGSLPAAESPTTHTATIATGSALSTVTQSVSIPLAAATNTINPGFSPTLTETLHPRFYGTLPPNLPSGKIVLVNKSKKEVYISLQCTTKDGYISILEYPVPRQVETRGPAGKYIYVAWVGGNKSTGKFSLGAQGEIIITINKDGISIK